MLKTYRLMEQAVGSQVAQLRLTLVLATLSAILQGIAYALFFPLFSALLARPVPVTTVWLLIGSMAGLTLLEASLRWHIQGLYTRLMLSSTHELRLVLGEHLRRIPLERLFERRTGDLNTVLGKNVVDATLALSYFSVVVIQTLCMPAVVILVTCFFDWRLALVLLFTIPLALPLYRWLRALNLQEQREVTEADASVASRVIEYVQGLAVLKATGQVGTQSTRLRAALETQRLTQERTHQLSVLPNLLMTLVIQVSLLVVLALGIYWILQGTLALPLLAALLVIAVRFSEPLSILATVSTIFDMMENGLERIHEVLTIQPLPQPEGSQSIASADIVFEHVTFTYANQEKPALRDVSLVIPARSLTALVGPSGSGKTTITRLLSRYADVQQGAIRIGGVDVREMPQAELMRHLSVVFQDVYLFDDTIRNNIRLAKPDASDAEVEAAAREAYCHDFITQLPAGYDTRIGELGATLSGGERQRLSIARALLKNAPLVLLDEPTSALDTASEIVVQQAIDHLVANRTVVVIAHRLSTIQHADTILVLEDGCLIEQGTHAQLLARGTRYAAMWQAQQQARRWKGGITSFSSTM
jgi:ATP-binding cassette, subfamily B, bacterial IrtB/YbtQ